MDPSGNLVLTIVDRVLLLAEVDVFRETRTEDLAHLAAAGRELELGPGDVLFSAGDPPDGLHVVISGHLALTDGTWSGTAGRGDPVGVFGLLDHQPRSLTATARETSRVLTVDRHAFEEAIADCDLLALGVLDRLAGQLRAAWAAGAGRPDDAARSLG